MDLKPVTGIYGKMKEHRAMNGKVFKFMILILGIFLVSVIAVLVFTRNIENNILPKQKNEIIINKGNKAAGKNIIENKEKIKKEPITESPIKGPLLN